MDPTYEQLLQWRQDVEMAWAEAVSEWPVHLKTNAPNEVIYLSALITRREGPMSPDQVEKLCRRILDTFPHKVREHRSGKSVLAFLIGRAVIDSCGSVPLREANETFKRLIDESPVV
jgi:hypothetical protein